MQLDRRGYQDVLQGQSLLNLVLPPAVVHRIMEEASVLLDLTHRRLQEGEVLPLERTTLADFVVDRAPLCDHL